MKYLQYFLLIVLLALTVGCAKQPISAMMETTAYCGCQTCCDWQRGSPSLFHIDFWNKYTTYGNEGPYTGKTASGKYPSEPQEGLFSMDSLTRPWMIPVRTILFPWYFLPQDGTIAADTKYYPFGTRMYVPGYGWGVVADRGGAIKGKSRIDLYFESHNDALRWGRKKLPVTVEFQ